jgi:hypothetical protein
MLCKYKIWIDRYPQNALEFVAEYEDQALEFYAKRNKFTNFLELKAYLDASGHQIMIHEVEQVKGLSPNGEFR